MNLILIHGMGRTPASMLFLRHRLRKQGHEVRLFGYLPSVESLEDVVARLARSIDTGVGAKRYVLVGHSLGAVIIRSVLPRLGTHQPVACFFLAPPMLACRAAKFFAPFWPYRLITGEMGQLLAQDNFMMKLPVPKNARIYAGTGGPTASWSPFGKEANDGILSLTEATGNTDAVVVRVPSTHTFIMNGTAVFDDLACALKDLG
jgi:hypothetical protein